MMLMALLLFSLAALAQPPQRIVSGMPSITEMLFALGVGDRVVGVTTNCNYPPGAKRKTKVGGFFLNLETVAALKPDLVLMIEDAQKKDIERFRNYGLNVRTIDPKTVEGVLTALLEVGKMTGTEKEANDLAAALRRRIEKSHRSRLDLSFILSRPRVLAIVGAEPLVVAGGGTFIDDILKYVGADNIAGRAKAAYPQFSYEQLLTDDPEYLIVPAGLVKKSQLAKDGRWQKISAVRNGRVLNINADIISRPGPRVAEAIETIASFLRK